MPRSVHRIDAYSNDALAKMFGEAFANYIAGEFAMDGDGLRAFLYTNHADVNASQVVRISDEFAGLVIVSNYGARSRVAAMGVALKFRGQGVGDSLVMDVCDAARDRGQTAMVLEVIEQNEPAAALYRKHGFDVTRRLCGWRIHHPTGVRGVRLMELASGDLAKAAAGTQDQDLPWQIALPTLSRLAAGVSAYHFGSTYVAVSLGDSEIVVETLFTLGNELNLSEAGDCLRGLFALYPGRSWRVPVRFPEYYAPAFEIFAAERETLTQLQMERRL